MIRYLSEGEKAGSRKLWEEAFPEDSRGFVDFYYAKRAGENQILAAIEDGQIAAMLHRNPYLVAVKNQVWPIDYIAGVATALGQRRRGHMGRLLTRLFQDLYLEHMAFCFLVPANPALYERFGFTFICDLPKQTLNERASRELQRLACVDRPGGCREAADLAGRLLRESCEVYVLRDEEYYRSLCREVRSDEGELFFLYSQAKKEELVGILAYYGEKGEELRELLCLPEFKETTGEKEPWAMGRIIDLARFMQVISLREDCHLKELEVFLEVRDEYVHQNNGLFCWRLSREGSSLSRTTDKGEGLFRLSLEIRELTEWLFGYREPFLPENQQELLEYIRPLRGVYFDEIT